MIYMHNVSKTFFVEKYSQGLKGRLKKLLKPEMESVSAVRDINFTIENGEFVGLIGANGAGKTTLIKLMTGLLYPDAGSDINVLGYNPFEKSHDFLKSISLVSSQKNQLLWDLTAMESFELQRKIYEVPMELFKKNISTLSELLDCEDKLNKPIRQLSFGEKMKLELMLSLLHSPKILFLDEPTVGLDFVTQKSIRTFLKEYNRKLKATIVLTSHNINDIKKLCDRLICIRDHSIFYDGSQESFVNSSKYQKLEIRFGETINNNLLMYLNDIAEIIDCETYKLVMRINKSCVSKVIQEASSYNAEDIQITEDDLENVITTLFIEEKEMKKGT